MTYKKIKPTIFLFAIFLLLFTNCSGLKGKKHKGEEEIAAKILMDNPELSKFQLTTDAIEETKFISISLERSAMMAGRKSKMEITYNSAKKKWTGNYEAQQYPIKGSQVKEKKEKWDNLSPKSGWLSLVKALDENKVHSIRDAKSIDYKEMLADGEAFNLTIRIGNKQRRYSFSNPKFYSREYPEIKDFTYFSTIIDLFHKEFISGLSED